MSGEFVKWLLATFGLPAGVALYFMLKDWFFTSDLVRVLQELTVIQHQLQKVLEKAI